MSFFSFGQSAEVDVVLNDAETRKKAEHKTEDGKKDKYFLFYDGETVSGKVNVTLKNPGKRLEHQGIKIEFVGQIGMYMGRVVISAALFSYWTVPASADMRERERERRIKGLCIN